MFSEMTKMFRTHLLNRTEKTQQNNIVFCKPSSKVRVTDRTQAPAAEAEVFVPFSERGREGGGVSGHRLQPGCHC